MNVKTYAIQNINTVYLLFAIRSLSRRRWENDPAGLTVTNKCLKPLSIILTARKFKRKEFFDHEF